MSDSAFARIVAALEGHGLRVAGTGHRRQAQCPSHDDSTASLSVTGIETQALIYCHAGCETGDILGALGLGLADLYDTRRGADYRYPDGRIVHRKVHKNKGFPQSGNTHGADLYRLDRVRAAVAANQPVYVTEGEKDVLAIESLGAVATCSAMGAGKAHKADWSPLAGAEVRIVADRDTAGEKHARDVYSIVTELGATASVLHAKAGKDAADHVAAGYGIDDFEPLRDKDMCGAVVRTLADVTPERVQWLWPGRLPAGKVVVIDGDPSTGKSTLTLDMAARVSTGNRWPDHVDCPLGDVLLMSAEDGLADTIAPRLTAAGADPRRVHALTEVTILDEDATPRRVPPTLPRDVRVMEQIIRTNQVRLCVIDVLMAFLAGKVDSHRDQDVRGVLHQLAAMAERTGCTIVLIRHLNKSGAGSPLYRGGGSIGIVGAARAAFLVARDPEDDERRIFAVTKSNLAAEPPALAYRLVDAPALGCARVVWEDQPTDHSAADLLRAPVDTEERTERDQAADWLTDYLHHQGGQAARKDVFKAGRAAGFSEATLKRAKDKARVSHESGGFPRTTVWIHPDARTVTALFGSPAAEPTGPEPTDHSGSDLREHTTMEPQSAHPPGVEPTEPSEPSLPPQSVTPCHENRPCDRCSSAPSRLGFDGGRYCQACAPTLWHQEAS